MVKMIDKVFEIKGGLVSGNYVFDLWDETVRILPWLDTEEMAGILPLRGSVTEEGLLLSLRSRLVLRLPVELAVKADALAGQELHVGSSVLHLGSAAERQLQPHTTLHAKLVESEEDEITFLDTVAARLQDMGISCKWICGKSQTITGTLHNLPGYSLVLHDLNPADSLRIQRVGLGGSRRYGCGIFVPYKTISDLN